MSSENDYYSGRDRDPVLPREVSDEHRQRADVYKKWQASLEDLPPETRQEVIAESLANRDELIRYQSERKAEALNDPLTGLPSRRLFDKIHETLFWQGNPYGFLVVDIDRFKHINDTVGHDGGDTVLREVASRLTYSVRHEGETSPPAENHRRRSHVMRDFIGRWGGEEFAILLPGMDSEQTLFDRAEKMRSHIAESSIVVQGDPHFDKGTIFDVTASIGGALRRRGDNLLPNELLRVADRALYHSKDNGRNMTTIYQPKKPPLSTKRT
jgi:GGDEF domain-containing protein